MIYSGYLETCFEFWNSFRHRWECSKGSHWWTLAVRGAVSRSEGSVLDRHGDSVNLHHIRWSVQLQPQVVFDPGKMKNHDNIKILSRYYMINGQRHRGTWNLRISMTANWFCYWPLSSGGENNTLIILRDIRRWWKRTNIHIHNVCKGLLI